ncbi:methyltransferase domain-containing protein, partial [Planktothrix sp. FACHB-1355]
LGTELIKQKNLEDKIEIKFGDATNLDFESESFTKVMAIECAFHFNTRKDFFYEAFRVLKPGGVLAMTDIIPSPGINLSNYNLERIREYLSADAKMYNDRNIYSLDVYQKYLQEAGFDPMKIYSIKDKVILQFADHLDSVEAPTDDAQERISKYAKAFRNQLMVGGDYIVVRAQKPK